MKLRSKKDRQESIVIESKHWGRERGAYSFLHKIRSSIPVPKNLGYDSRLVMNRLDPGIRTFITGYSPDGYTVEWGKGDIARIYRLCHVYDKLQSIRSTSPGKTFKHFRYKLRRSMLRLTKKIRNLVNDCHRKSTQNSF